MLSLPKQIIYTLRNFEEVFSERVWEWAKVLLIGVILAPGERTVAAVLRVMGQQDEKQFQNYHRVQSLGEVVKPSTEPYSLAFTGKALRSC